MIDARYSTLAPGIFVRNMHNALWKRNFNAIAIQFLLYFLDELRL
jgi:hypothetical protein